VNPNLKSYWVCFVLGRIDMKERPRCEASSMTTHKHCGWHMVTPGLEEGERDGEEDSALQGGV
jgi:hypothetical protein